VDDLLPLTDVDDTAGVRFVLESDADAELDADEGTLVEAAGGGGDVADTGVVGAPVGAMFPPIIF